MDIIQEADVSGVSMTSTCSRPDSDIDSSFTSTTSSTTFTSSSSTSTCCSARSSVSVSSSFSSSSWSSSLLKPRPHRSSDAHWTAVRAAAALSSDGNLHLKLLRQLGSGNLARVFHCRLADDTSGPDFALKVIDTDALARAKDSEKLSHVQTEAEVLSTLDHPFLPTLYARLESPRHTGFLIDYCAGGDLNTLLRRQPNGIFPLNAVRFFAAEVVVALEYLHALGYVYRDLKPENILRRSDGHLVLSDFDLCLKSHVSPSLHKTTKRAPPRKKSNRIFRYLLCSGGKMEEEPESEEVVTEVVLEPRGTSSRDCVGTHEYLAPEVLTREGHAAGVDWWALGVLIYEMLTGTTPFKGGEKESTLRNIKSKALTFPVEMKGKEMAAARDLVGRLLVKDPRRRMGGELGALEVKRHLFFQGIKWELIRNCPAPRGVGRRRK